MSSLPVDFQCVICFDDFDNEEKPPVVLPCGHTMVCAPCAKRLSRCMECRTSLFVSAPSSQQTGSQSPPPPPSPTARNRYSSSVQRVSASSSYGSPGRYGNSNRAGSPVPPSTPKTRQAEQKIPLPLPKNLVMLDLMEENARKKKQTEGNEEGDGVGVEPDPTCGTYEVRDRDGLVVLSNNPPTDATDAQCSTGKASSSRRGFWRIKKKKANSQDIEWPKSSQPLSVLDTCKDEKHKSGCITSLVDPAGAASCDSDTLPSLTSSLPKNQGVVHGQKLQIVHIKEGFAKLSRGRGYVVADSTQLVKVGGPQDDICEMEAKISHIASKREQLRRKLLELDEEEAKLKGEIKTALSNGSDHPVIESATSVDGTGGISDENPSLQGPPSPLSPPPVISESQAQSTLHSDPTAQKRRPFEDSTSCIPKVPILAKGSPSKESTFLSKSFDDADRRGNDIGCVDRMLGQDQTREGGEGFNDILDDRAPSQSTRASNVPPRTSADWVDFRTGMSGHMGLGRRRTSVNRSQCARGEVRMMSEHRGASHIKPIRKRTSSTNNSSPTSIISRPTW